MYTLFIGKLRKNMTFDKSWVLSPLVAILKFRSKKINLSHRYQIWTKI